MEKLVSTERQEAALITTITELPNQQKHQAQLIHELVQLNTIYA